MAGRLFDTVVMVDWSARSSPSPARPAADAIWTGIARVADGRSAVGEAVYRRTRAGALAELVALLAGERRAGRRVLAGFDFPFGLPAGAAERIAGRPDGLALWDWLAARIEDRPDNANNRYALAEEINALWPGPGPFWGRPRGLDRPGVPERKAGIVYSRPAERRIVERRVRAAKPVWQLAYAGSVGSQALLGIAGLARLRRDPRLAGIAVWPFETGLAAPVAPIVLAEIYPSLLAPPRAIPRGDGEVVDAAQVRAMAGRLAALDAAGALAPFFAAAPRLDACCRATVAREEAWILGAGREAALGGPPRAP
jgi:hypothetical protein